MARGNMVYMMGKVLSRPLIKINEEGEYISGRLTILTVRRSGLNSKSRLAGEVRADEQLILSRDSYLIEHKLANIQEGDMVIVKGTLSTRDVPKKIRCPWCSEIAASSLGVIVYVDPLTITRMFSTDDMTDEEVQKFLGKNAELSNYAACFGTLVREPRYAPDYGVTNRRETNIQVALNRKRMIVEDGPDKRTDYPYIRAFGKIAEETAKVLHTGSEIYVEGAVETRKVEIEKNCPFCEKDFIVQTSAVEIVPYTIEYISDVDTSILLQNEEEETLDTKSDIAMYTEQQEQDEDMYDDDYEDNYDEGEN